MPVLSILTPLALRLPCLICVSPTVALPCFSLASPTVALPLLNSASPTFRWFSLASRVPALLGAAPGPAGGATRSGWVVGGAGAPLAGAAAVLPAVSGFASPVGEDSLEQPTRTRRIMDARVVRFMVRVVAWR